MRDSIAARAAADGATVVSAPIGPHPAVAELILRSLRRGAQQLIGRLRADRGRVSVRYARGRCSLLPGQVAQLVRATA